HERQEREAHEVEQPVVQVPRQGRDREVAAAKWTDARGEDEVEHRDDDEQRESPEEQRAGDQYRECRHSPPSFARKERHPESIDDEQRRDERQSERARPHRVKRHGRQQVAERAEPPDEPIERAARGMIRAFVEIFHVPSVRTCCKLDGARGIAVGERARWRRGTLDALSAHTSFRTADALREFRRPPIRRIAGQKHFPKITYGGHMRFCKLMLGMLFAVPALAQGTASQPKPDVKATFSVMKANVAKITAPSEKERWEPNKDAWEVAVAQTGKLQTLDLGKISAALDKI